MIAKGQKRKLPMDENDALHSGATWESQRQFVFSVSLSKYQRGQELPEPSLRRTVLIANTLRHISLDGDVAPAVQMEAPPPPPSCSSEFTLQEKEQEGILTSRHSATPCENDSSALTSSPLAAGCTSSCPTEDEDWESMSSDPDFCLSAAISSILTALDSIDGGPQAAQRAPLQSLENLSGSPEVGVAWTKQGLRGYGGGWERQEECKASVEAGRSGFLRDLAVEDLFQDIDTSLLERDMGSLGVRGGVGGHGARDDVLTYLPPLSSSSFPSHPFSLSLNQNLKCLPSFASFCPSSSSSSSPFSPSDGLELEHLMEILVES
ncbi:SERTA domain-containing protein 3 isoform X1 [Genypterus blacodes]|uniref:SERTA domain-containing protein 3 isoform X1 n=1 Tax=Genypterus blacodes TaxID=154954 RepID=UPI003F761731